MNVAKIREMAEKEVGDRAWEEFTVHDLIQLMNRAIAQDREDRDDPLRMLNRTVNKACTCGGAGRGEGGCPACEMYHALKDVWEEMKK